MSTYVVQTLFDSRSGNFDAASGLFDDTRLPSDSLNVSISPTVAVVASWDPALSGALGVSLASSVAVMAILPAREAELNVSLEGSAVESHQITWGSQGTYTANAPAAPAPYNPITP